MFAGRRSSGPGSYRVSRVIRVSDGWRFREVGQDHIPRTCTLTAKKIYKICIVVGGFHLFDLG